MGYVNEEVNKQGPSQPQWACKLIYNQVPRILLYSTVKPTPKEVQILNYLISDGQHRTEVGMFNIAQSLTMT